MTASSQGRFYTIAACGDHRPMVQTIFLVLLFELAIVVTPSAKAQLTCSPAPCTTANVQASNGAANTTVAGFALAANPVSTSDLAFAANYLVDMSSCFGSGDNPSWTSAFISTNQGSSWSGGCQPRSGSDVAPQFDPVAIYDSSGNLFSGQLGATTTAEGVFLQELPNGTLTWGDFFPTLSFTDKTTVKFYNYDFPGLGVDSSNCLYVTAWELGFKLSNNESVSAVAVGQSCNAGANWTTKRVSALVAGPQIASYPRVVVASNGTLLATWIQNNGGNTPKVYAASSSNGGNTWTAYGNVFNIQQTAAASCPNNNPHVDRALPHTCVRMFYFPQLSSTAGSQFNAVYPIHSGNQIQINYRSSTNSGAVWSSAVALDVAPADPTATGDQFEACISSPSPSSSTLGVAWLDTRNSPKGKPDTLYDAYAIVSTDGGSTWSSVYRLSTQSSSTTVETGPHSEYLGDWTGCAWQNGIFYYVFPSTANGTNQVAMIGGVYP